MSSTTPLPIHLTFTAALSQQAPGSRNANQLALQFPVALNVRDCSVALVDVSVPVSWPNISVAYGDQTLQYRWIDGSLITVTLPDQTQQTIASLNQYLTNVMTSYGHYLASTNGGSNTYFISLTSNLSYTRTQLSIWPVPSTLPSNTALPANANWNLPSTPTTPQVIIPPATTPSSMSTLIGFAPGTAPPAPQATFYQVVGQAASTNPVQQVFVQLDRAMNLSQPGPNNTLYTFPVLVPYGSTQREQPGILRPVHMQDGQFTSMQCSLVDQLGRAVPVMDGNWSATIKIDSRGVLR